MITYITREQLDAIRAADLSFNYDTAIPQGIFDSIVDVTGENPCGHVCFVYQSSMIGGGLMATSETGARLLRAWLSAETSHA